jgi:hypothetical protein
VSPGLKIDQKAQPLFSGEQPGMQDLLATGHVHGYRLSQEHMPTRVDSSLCLLGMKVWRGLDNHRVQLRRSQFAVRIGTVVSPPGINVQLRPSSMQVIADYVG